MERVRRRTGDRVPPGGALTGRQLSPDQVRKWARYVETSPLYLHLSEVIAGDPELMRVLNRIEHTPEPNILFAGVQFILSREGGGRLGFHYPNFAGDDAPIEGVAAPFKEFVLAHEEELCEIGRTRYTQTNECRRCVALLPAIWITGVERFHLVDVGTSAGLNLLIDYYHYRWDGVTWGADSPVELVTENRGAPVTPREVEILSRTGLDLHPVDPADEGDRRWLEALIWPEHRDRRERLRAALEVAQTVDIELIVGDAIELLGPTIQRLPREEPVVVMHSFVLNQFHPAARESLGEILAECRTRRVVHQISMEALDPGDPTAALAVDSGSGLERVARAQPHGEWLELYARP